MKRIALTISARAAVVLIVGAVALLAVYSNGDFPPAYAATFTVNSTADTVDANPGDGVCADGTGACTLRSAIQEANALSGADIVSLPPGTYTLTIPLDIDPSPNTGDLDITDALTIDGAGSVTTIIDGNGVVTGDRVLDVGQPVTVEISDVTIQNGAGGDGGGIRNSGTLTIVRSTITDNQTAGNGGGISTTGPLKVVNSTISGNRAPSDVAGGIFSDVNSGTVQINNSAIALNVGEVEAGGLASIGEVSFELGNTIIANNVLIDGPTARNCQGAALSLGHNLDTDGTCGLVGQGDLNGPNFDAMLGPLADNGGPTFTHALLPGSPAIDAGDPGQPGTCESTDQRGQSRPQDGDADGTAVCDIGAYEFVPPTLTVVKVVTNGGNAVPADFMLHVTDDGEDVAGSPFQGEGAPGTEFVLLPGTYTVVEDPAAGFVTTFLGDCDAVALVERDKKTCTVTNDGISPTLTVTKIVTNDNGGAKQISDFTLRVDGAAINSGATTTLSLGPHTVGEDAIPGYTTTFGGDCAADGTITLAVADEKACTITNDDMPATLTVNKVVVNTKSEQLFLGDKELAIKTAADFKLRVDGAQVQSGTATTVNAGSRTVSEDEPSADFYSATISGDCAPANGSSTSITLQPGAVKTCTITNTFDEQRARAAGARGRRLPPTGGPLGAADDDFWIFVVVASAGTVLAMTVGYVLLKRRGFS